MSSADEGSSKAVIATLGRPGGNDEAAKMMVGGALRQAHGRWDTTTANAWGTIAAKKFAGRYPASAIMGTTTMSLGTQSISRVWPLAGDQRTVSFPLPSAQVPLMLRQSSGVGPWATVQVSAAVPLKQALFAGYRLPKKIEPISQRVKGQWTRGDVARVVIAVDSTAERNWVVVN